MLNRAEQEWPSDYVEDYFLCRNCEHTKDEHNGKCSKCDCSHYEVDPVHFESSN